MKTRSLLLSAVLVTALGAQTQPPQQPSRQLPRPRITNAAQTSELSQNYTISIKGSMGKSEPFDVILRGSSSKFSADLAEPNRSIEIILNEGDKWLSVTYAIRAPIAVKSDEASISYQDTNIRGSFLAKLGEPFPVLEVGDSKLTIQVDHVPPK